MDNVKLVDAKKLLLQAQIIVNAAAQLQNMCTDFMFTNNIRGYFAKGTNEITDDMFTAPVSKTVDENGKEVTPAKAAGELYQPQPMPPMGIPFPPRDLGMLVKIQSAKSIVDITEFCADVAPIVAKYAPIFEVLRNDR
jgi:hypothetical protein